MRVIDMADIIRAMQNETQFVLRCEEVFHDKISSAAASILSAQPHKPFVCLTGPSGSGKTTTAMRLKAYLENLGVKVCQLSMDNFFLPLDQRPPEATDWESPYCVNRELLLDTVDKLSRGETAQVPWYDFKNNKTGGYTPMEGSREAIIIAEGIHMLNPLLFDPMRSRATGVYVAPRTRIITPDDRIVKPEQVRVARRMIRDYLSRGRTLRETIERAQSVDQGEVQYIAPNKKNASIHIDTFHDYEPCILTKYLREIPKFSEELTPEFMRAHNLDILMDVAFSNTDPCARSRKKRGSVMDEIRISHVSKSYTTLSTDLVIGNAKRPSRTRKVLEDVNLAFPAGQLSVLVGRSGCGKSTLLKMLAGKESPDSGEISLPHGWHAALLGPEPYVITWTNVRQNVAMASGVGKTPEERYEHALEYVRLVGLEDCADLSPVELSTGMKQRLGLARVLASQAAHDRSRHAPVRRSAASWAVRYGHARAGENRDIRSVPYSVSARFIKSRASSSARGCHRGLPPVKEVCHQDFLQGARKKVFAKPYALC